MKKTISLVFLFLGFLLSVTPVLGQEISRSVIIQLAEEAYENQVSLTYWQLPQEVSSTAPDDLAKNLYQLTDEQLDDRYGKRQLTAKANEQDQILLTDLPDGVYYVRENSQSSRRLVPFIITLPQQRGKFIKAKVTDQPREPRGRYSFLKQSSQGGSLEGARFQVYHQATDGSLEPVSRQGMTYEVVSGPDGKFEVTDLPFGDYALVEVVAPKGYVRLAEPVAFEVTDYSGTTTPLQIVNKPERPPKIIVPYTGNTVVILVLSIGFLLVLVGYYLVKTSGNDA